jgi:hypothetical protein
MTTIKQSLKNGLAMLTMGLAATYAQETKKPFGIAKTGYNAIETAMSTSGSHPEKSRLRAFTNVGLTNGNTAYAISGMNQITGGNASTYFGNNKFLAGTSDISATVRTIWTPEGLVDTKIGVQTQALTKPLHATYCRSDVTANSKSLTWETLYGKVLSSGPLKGWTLEGFHGLSVPRKGKTGNYTELQVYTPTVKSLGGVQGFARAEVASFDFSKATYLIGGVKTF